MTKFLFWGGVILCEIPESVRLSTMIGNSVSNNSHTVCLSVFICLSVILLFTMFICLVIVILGFGSLVDIICKDL